MTILVINSFRRILTKVTNNLKEQYPNSEIHLLRTAPLNQQTNIDAIDKEFVTEGVKFTWATIPDKLQKTLNDQHYDLIVYLCSSHYDINYINVANLARAIDPDNLVAYNNSLERRNITTSTILSMRLRKLLKLNLVGLGIVLSSPVYLCRYFLEFKKNK